MSGAWRKAAKAAVPAPLRTLARAWLGWRWFEGNYATWAEAQAASGGYDDEAIVDRVAAATRAVRAGEAAYERDGVGFAEPAPERELLAALGTAAGDGPLRVLDFGGALGTTYWRHRRELAEFSDLTWDIVEQPAFVARGAGMADGTPLRFFPSVAAAEAAGRHDVLLVSTALQYLADPAAELAAWLQRGFPWLLFNNLPLHTGAPDRIAVQRVPPSIYRASYPVWFFNREQFLARFESRYELVTEFASEAVWPVGGRRYPSSGLLWRRKGAR
jgi:putative methyltransferase (TIGR04325 family)